jgi:hypothetical protein
MNVFKSNAAEFTRLHQRLMETVRHRNESKERFVAWQEASAVLLASYDRLSFPGGLARELALLKVGNSEAIELAVRYLEADPWHFRTGYNKEDIIRQLRKHPLTEDQCARLRMVILNRVHGRPVREMRSYARLASNVSSPEFEAELMNIATNSSDSSARHANWVLESLKRLRKADSPAKTSKQSFG